MYLWASKGRPLSQFSKRCFCQGNTVFAQHTVVSVWNNNIFLSKKYSDNILVNKTPVLPKAFIPQKRYNLTIMSEHSYSSSSSENQEAPKEPTLSNKAKLKRAVKDYGATVIIFHVTISLMSLGISYLVISSGVDVASLLSKIGINTASDVATGASTFVVAYAVHKVFAPVRISITLGCTPFIVRYLRRVGILKPPKSTGP